METVESNNDSEIPTTTTIVPQLVNVNSLSGESLSQNGVQQIVLNNPTVATSQTTVKSEVVTTEAQHVNTPNEQQIITVSDNALNHSGPVVQAVKRPLSSTGTQQGPVISKVIIRNTNSTQPVPTGLVGTSTTNKITPTLVQTADGKQILTDGNGRQLVSATGSPLKFVTVSQGNTGQKNVILTTAPTSPIKPIAPLSKVPIAPISPDKKSDTPAQYQKASNVKRRKIAELIQLNSGNSNQGRLALPSGIVKIVSVPSSSVAATGAVVSGTSASSSIPVHVQTISPSKQILKPASSTTTIHPIQLSAAGGGKMPLMRIVSVTTGTTTSTSATKMVTTIAGAKPIAPSLSTVVSGSSATAKIPIAPSNSGKMTTQPRFIMPANTPTFKIINASGVKPLAGLPPGTTLLAPQGSNILQGLTVIPSNYVTGPQLVTTQQDQLPQLPQENDSNTNGIKLPTKTNGVLPDGTAGRPRKPCNCTKSQCLKLYCDCFANGEFCHECNCCNCLNNQDHEDDRKRAIKSCLERNPQAFHPKIGKGAAGQSQRRHNKGCNCKRSGCLKNYCECYEAKIPCSSICKCVGCKNFEESPDRKSLMHLADAAEVRHQQQAAAKDKLSSQIQEFPERPPEFGESGERLPFSFITSEVAEATCNCMMAQAEDAVRLGVLPSIAERMVLEEFGRCLKHVISSASRSKGPS